MLSDFINNKLSCLMWFVYTFKRVKSHILNIYFLCCKCFTVNVFPVCLSTLLSVVIDSRPKTWSIDLMLKKTSQCCINMSKIEYEKNDLFGT